MKVHKQVGISVVACLINEFFCPINEVILADGVVHVDPFIDLAACEDEGGYIAKREVWVNDCEDLWWERHVFFERRDHQKRLSGR